MVWVSLMPSWLLLGLLGLLLITGKESTAVDPLETCCNYARLETRRTENDFNTSSNLLQCVNKTVTLRYHLVTSECEPLIGPTLSIVLVTRITPEIYKYGSCTYFLTAAYAERNNYVLLPLFDDSDSEDFAYHRKLVPILEVLQSVLIADYVVWMDAGM